MSFVLSSVPQKCSVTAMEEVCPVYVNILPELPSPNLTKTVNNNSVSCYKQSQGIQRLIVVQPCQISLYLKVLFLKIMLYPFIAHFKSVVVATKNRHEKKQKVK